MADNKPYQVPVLTGGISEQSAQERPSSTCEDQINCINDPLNDVIARPGGRVINSWNKDFTDPFEFTIRRSQTEVYKVLIEDGEMMIINLLDGTLASQRRFADKKVRMDSYLKHTGSARQAFAAVTVQDQTFIVNKQKLVKWTSERTQDRANQAIFYFRSASYSSTYVATIKIGTTQYHLQYSTPDNSDTDNALYIKTNTLAHEFCQALNGLKTAYPTVFGSSNPSGIAWKFKTGPSVTITDSSGSVTGYASATGSSILVTAPPGVDFTVDTSDGNGDTEFICFKDLVSKFSDLPERCFSDYIVGVQGSKTDQTDDYWVQFQGNQTTGTWVEIPKPGIKDELDAATMPHTLSNVAKNVFTCGRPKWGKRLCGDGDKTAKTPMMVGDKIRDLAFISGRLALIGEGYLQLSRSRNAYVFFPDTAQARLDTDPIGVNVQTGDVTVIKNSLTIAGKLFLWADGNQVRLDSGDNALTETTVDFIPSTNYEYDGKYRPIATGMSSAIFGATTGESTKLREVQYRNGAPIGEIPLNDHCPKLIAGSLRRVSVSPASGFLIALVGGVPSQAYVYQWLNRGDQRVQTAWNRWTFKGVDKVVDISVLPGLVAVLCKIGDTLVLEHITLDPTDLAKRYIRLDHRVTSYGLTVSPDDGWYYDLPYTVGADDRDDYVCISQDVEAGKPRGKPIKFTWANGGSRIKFGPVRPDDFYFGARVVSYLDFTSPLYVQDPRTGNTVLPDRTFIHSLRMSHAETSEYKVVVTNLETREDDVQTFYGRDAISRYALNELPNGTGEHVFPIQREAKNIKVRLLNDTVFPSRWSQAVWNYAEQLRT